MHSRAIAIVFAGAMLASCASETSTPAEESSRGGAAGDTPPVPSNPPLDSQGGGGQAPSPPPPASTGGGGGGTGGGGGPPPGLVPGLVAVGYGGLRLTSRDAGKTWTGTASAMGGGDDENLLRAVAYAGGKWLAVGWRATTSADGVTWSPLAKINAPGGVTWNGAPSCGLVEGLTSDGKAFYAACAEYNQPHKAYRSTDGVNWTAIGTIGTIGGHPALAYRGGMFYAYGDLGTSFRSSDGVTWTVAAGVTQATYCENQWKSRAACHDASWFGGFYFQSIWQSKVTRSSDGQTFSVVHDDASNNTLYAPRAIGEGFVKP